jgi:hypothetical protein
MSPAEVRDRCLSLTGGEETFPFGLETSVLKVAGKMFEPELSFRWSLMTTAVWVCRSGGGELSADWLSQADAPA